MFISPQDTYSAPATATYPTAMPLGPKHKTIVIDNIPHHWRIEDILHELVSASGSLRPQRASLTTFSYTQRLRVEFTTSIQASHALSYLQRQQHVQPRGWNFTVESLFLLDDNESQIDFSAVLRRPMGTPMNMNMTMTALSSSMPLQCPRNNMTPIPSTIDPEADTSSSSRSTSPSLSSVSWSSANRVDGHPLTRSPSLSPPSQQRSWSNVASGIGLPPQSMPMPTPITNTVGPQASPQRIPISPAKSSFTVTSSSSNSNPANLSHHRRDLNLHAQNQKLYARDPHKGPRSTDWMLSDETLRLRREKDEKFAQMVAMGLAKGRTKAGWAQARRPGKRDREAAKRRLAEIQSQDQNGVEELVQSVQSLTVAA